MALFRSKTAGQQIRVSVAGATALKKRLDEFGKKIKNKALKAALKEMGKPIAKGVSAAAPKDTKILSQNIRAKVLKSKRTKEWSLRVGAQNKWFKVVRSTRNRKFNKSVKKKMLAGKMGGRVRWHSPAKISPAVSEGTKWGAKPTHYLRKGLAASKQAASAAFIGSMKNSIREAAREAKSA